MKATTEQAFESAVEEILLRRSGWERGDLGEWDPNRALFPAVVLDFLRTTHPEPWQRLEGQLGADLETRLLERLCRELDGKGALEVLRHGFKVNGRTLRLAWFRPAHSLNEETAALYARNRLSVTRQVPCHPNDGSTVDLLFALNGLPLATCELKNPATGQNWRHAVRQYREDRNPRAPLFRFGKRTLAHFAVDPDEVHLTTRLAGKTTRFLPFNRGSRPGEPECGAGNPPNPNGYRTAYFFEETLARDSFLDLLGRFLFVEKRNGAGKDRRSRSPSETVVFPRYHQLDAVRRLADAARREGPGRNYLIQHSAGSGKTNSIAWLSHRLMNLHDDNDERVFDAVVVITDRRVLDRQLQQAIYQIEHARGVVETIEKDSRQLAKALAGGARIVVTTLQKFPFVLRSLYRVAGADSEGTASAATKKQAETWGAEIAGRRYALIVDEAHSSQSGETARELRAILGAGAGAASGGSRDSGDSPDSGDSLGEALDRIIEARGPQPNLSYFAFTATPKGKTLELFGRKPRTGGDPGPAGEAAPRSFHLYSMRQAIEEGYILDVLERYTTYRSFWNLLKKVPEDPEVPERKALRALRRFVTLHPTNLSQKTEIIIEHFRSRVMRQIGGRAKAMVVTSSRLHAVRFMLSFERYLSAKRYTDVRPLVAFSGEVADPETGEKFTETRMNDRLSGRRISEAALAGEFAKDEFRILLVAEKYQTGFDQPLLAAMYVDKRLDGVQAVQTLSRLNRTHPGKDAPFVLDFVNSRDDIVKAFRPFYDRTELSEPSDPDRLETLKHDLDEAGIYHRSEVEAFARVFLRARESPQSSDHAELERWVQPAVDRFRTPEDDDEREEFRKRLSAFVNSYAYLSQILPYGDREWEMLYVFGRHLQPRLGRDDGAFFRLKDEVELEFLRTDPDGEGALRVAEEPAAYVLPPVEAGTGRTEEEEAPLSRLIEELNDRFGTEFGEADRLFFAQVRENAVRNEEVERMAQSNEFDDFRRGANRLLQGLVVGQLGDNERIVERFIADKEFQGIVLPLLAQAIYASARRPAEPLRTRLSEPS